LPADDQSAAPPEQDDVIHGLLDEFPDPVILVDADRKLVFANTEAGNLVDISQTGRDLAVSFRHPSVLEAVDLVLNTGRRQNVEVSLSAPVARIFQAQVNPIHLPSAGGDGTLILLRDMTALKSADQMRQDFVANVSHELRSPISSIIGFIETLRESAKDDPDSQDRFLGIMAEEGARMSRLIDDLLSLSRIEVSEHVPPSGQADIAAIIEMTAELLQVRAQENNMRIAIDRPPTLDPILGDSDELTEVFQNLLDNALKYGNPGSTIDVTIKDVDRLPDTNRPGVAVSVFNTGEGIESEHLPRLTERFYRIDKGRSRTMGGTGLGLAIVKHIINRHRGRLAVDSQLGEGVTFTVYLPR